MHKGRITLIIVSVIGMISAFLPWRTVSLAGLKSLGLSVGKDSLSQLGIDLNLGYVSLIGFFIIGIVAFLGNREKMISQGIPKMSVLVLAGLLGVYHLFVVIIFLLTKHESPSFGLYLALAASLLAVIVPYVFKPSGEFDIPSRKEIADDIEDSAEIIEEIADDVEDRIEDRFDDDDDKDDKGDKGGLIESDEPKK